MITKPLPYPLCFKPHDLVLHPLEGLAREMRVSRAFLRLCVSVGCPSDNGQLSAGRVLVWLFDHYEDVRAVAGLAPLAVVEALPPKATAQLRMVNALVTLLEFSRTRATQWRQKRHLRCAAEEVGLLGDRSA